MTQRERYLEALLFGRPDAVPFTPGGPRESTLAAWRRQGLPDGADYMAEIHGLVDARRADKGLPPADWHAKQPVTRYGVSFQMIPTFEEKVLEHKNGHYIVQDWMGAITEISDEYDYTYIRSAKDFVTRRWHKWPVQNRDDWERMKWRFNAKDVRRFAQDFDARCAVLRRRDYYVELAFNGPFWQLREFCGFEGLLVMTCEQPDLVAEMARFWKDFVSTLLSVVFDRCPPDGIHISEDMAFKEHPMLSPEKTNEICGPCYRQWVEQARAAGVRVFAIDSDGRIDELIPVYLDCGINCVDPMEVAAGNDINAIRAAFGTRLAMRGGVDKRAIAAGGRVLRAELDRIRPVVESGGYIPGCDHGVPADVSWPNFQDYALQLAGMTGWL